MQATKRAVRPLTRSYRRRGAGVRGTEVRGQEGPFAVRLFERVAPDGGTEWVVANHLAAQWTRKMVIDAGQVRWQVEAFPRRFK